MCHPVVRYVVVEIGPPGLYEPGRYSDLWRQGFHDCLDAQAAKKLDPDAAEAAGDALFGEAEKATDLSARTSRERPAILRNQVLARATADGPLPSPRSEATAPPNAPRHSASGDAAPAWRLIFDVHAPAGAGVAYGRGHEQATGGSPEHAARDEFVARLGVGPEVGGGSHR